MQVITFYVQELHYERASISAPKLRSRLARMIPSMMQRFLDQFGTDKISRLPIHYNKEQILDSVRRNRFTVLTAGTGAGKSTQVVQYLADDHFFHRQAVMESKNL